MIPGESTFDAAVASLSELLTDVSRHVAFQIPRVFVAHRASVALILPPLPISVVVNAQIFLVVVGFPTDFACKSALHRRQMESIDMSNGKLKRIEDE